MNRYGGALLLLQLLLAIPVSTGAQANDEINPLLTRATEALNRYPHLAAEIRCDDSRAPETYRRDCKTSLAGLAGDVEQAKQSIARYGQLPAPKAVDLFDVYQNFRRIMEDIQMLNSTAESFSQRNRELFAASYNNFVKVTGWFGGVVRDTIQSDETCSSPSVP